AARVLPAILHGRSRGLEPGGGPYPVPGEGRAALPAAVGAMADADAHGLATRGHPHLAAKTRALVKLHVHPVAAGERPSLLRAADGLHPSVRDRKSTRLNSSHVK